MLRPSRCSTRKTQSCSSKRRVHPKADDKVLGYQAPSCSGIRDKLIKLSKNFFKNKSSLARYNRTPHVFTRDFAFFRGRLARTCETKRKKKKKERKQEKSPTANEFVAMGKTRRDTPSSFGASLIDACTRARRRTVLFSIASEYIHI